MILLKKAVRDMLRNKRAYAACIALIAIAVLFYVAMSAAIGGVKASRDIYYEEYNVADVYAKANNIPKAAEDNLLAIDGVKDVNLRIVKECRVNMENTDKIVTMRLISIPDEYAGNLVNEVYYEGNDFAFDNDIWVDEGFMDIYGKSLGDSITLIISGRERDFNITATAMSPEYVYIVKNMLEVLPDPESFTIGFMSESAMARLLSQSTYNDVCMTLEEGYEFDDVKSALEDELSKYGLTELFESKDQVSYSMLDTEVSSMESMSTSIPFVFMFMSMMILYLMLKRVIEQDRTQIGTLRAFGYSAYAVLFHYLIYGIVTGVIGGILGGIGGYFAADAMGSLYAIYFKMPETGADFMGVYVALGLLISVGSGALGSFLGAGKILKLLPAEAMRPPAPKAMTGDFLNKLRILKSILSTTGSMAIRGIERSKLRSAFVVIGISFSFAMLAFIASFNDMIDVMLMDQYTKAQVYDLKVNFAVPVSKNQALSAAYNTESITLAETHIELPVELIHNHKRENMLLQGLEENSALYKIYDNDKKIYYPPPKGSVILSDKMAEDLEVEKSDTLKISSVYLEEDVELMVSDIITMSMGEAAFMEAESLKDIFHTSDIVTSVILNTNDSSYLKEHLKDGSNISFLEDVEMTLNNYQSFLAPYMSLIYVMEAISVFVAVAIIYNVSTISLSERQREYATLRVMGMQVNEVASIMNFEFWLLCFFGIILGFPLTALLKEMMGSMIHVDVFTFPTYTPPMAYIIAMLGCVLAVKLANLSAQGRIGKLDMVEVLKERE